MPLPIQFDWSEDQNMLYFVLHIRGVKAKDMRGNVLLSDVYVRVNCHPSLFEADLLNEIDPEHPRTRCRVGHHKIMLDLRKKEPGLWEEFRAKGTKQELQARRQQALQAAEEREKARVEKRDTWKQDMLKAGETEQWRLDRENREQIEKWEAEEKAKWEADVYAMFDEESGKLIEQTERQPLADGDLDMPDDVEAEEAPPRPAARAPAATAPARQAVERAAGVGGGEAAPLAVEISDEEAAQIRAGKLRPTPATPPAADPGAGRGDQKAIWSEKELDDTEEYIPDVRENPGKIGIRFSERPRPGVPVRDRGMRAPPFPKHQVKGDQPPIIAGDAPADESDPVWLKDKGDMLMSNGDYQGACNAYTEALKIALNARAFANRAVAQLYLGNLEQCLEDCNHALRILDRKNKVPEGQIPGPKDPQDEHVRARVEIRMGTAYLWLGALNKAEEHFSKALETEDGLEPDDLRIVKEDLARVQAAKAALLLKEKADSAAERLPAGNGEREQQAAVAVLDLYGNALAANGDAAVLYANRSYVQLRAGKPQDCLADGDTALARLKEWPTARRAPKRPVLAARLDPPFLDDPTFKHPDEVKQGEVDWLMKHGGGEWKDLPSLPPEYEWVKDVAEKQENAWIAIKKKMPKATIDAIRRATTKLQDVLYSRNPAIIREHLKVAIEENKVGEGASHKALRQAEEYAEKLEEHLKEREAEREEEQAEARRELEDFDLDDAMATVRSGIGQTGFSLSHPVERTRRRLFVKVLLRRARAMEELGAMEGAAAELRRALRAEPDNPEAKRRLAGLAAPPMPPRSPTDVAATGSTAPASGQVVSSPSAGTAATEAVAAGAPADREPGRGDCIVGQQPSSPSSGPRQARSRREAAGEEDDDEGDEGVDHSSTSQLVAAAAEYMKRSDYEGALQIYGYALGRCKVWDSPLTELRVLSNRSLCLQRLRGRLPELVSACNEALRRISQIRREGCGGEISEEMLLRMESACLSRRGNAYMQQRKTEEGNRDLAEVRDLLARIEELEKRERAAAAH